MCSTQPQRGGTAIACPVIEPPSHWATAPGGPMTGPALYLEIDTHCADSSSLDWYVVRIFKCPRRN